MNTDLFQISHHVIMVAVEDTAEELYNLFVVEVVHTLHHPWEKELHRQVQVPPKLIWRGMKSV